MNFSTYPPFDLQVSYATVCPCLILYLFTVSCSMIICKHYLACKSQWYTMETSVQNILQTQCLYLEIRNDFSIHHLKIVL